jgi:transcriptional regulator with XRE-family HTH domain
MADFGTHIRQVRERLLEANRDFSLRKVAMRAELEPAYLSKIERGIFPPPSEEAIVRLAGILGLNADVLLAMAGKLSKDLQQIILQRPELIAELLRQVKEAPDHAILRVSREVRDGQW